MPAYGKGGLKTVGEASDAQPQSTTLIFIAGIMPRSGTNYVARLLLAHPDLCRPQGHWELPLFDVADKFAEFHAAFARRREPGRLGYSLDDFARCFGDGLMERLKQQVPLATGPTGFLLHKNPGTRGIEHFRQFFPEGRLIFLIRDGRDNVNSLLAASGFRGRRWSIKRWALFYIYAKEWARSAGRILDYASSTKTGCLIVRYEDLHFDQEQVLLAVANYANLPVLDSWLSEVKDMPVKGSTFYRGGGNSARDDADKTSWQETSKTSQFQPVGRWRKSWSRLEEWLFYRIAGRELRALDYKE
jgi:hypothetical protein